MQDPVSIMLYQLFERHGFGVLRYNSRGVGRSQGVYDQGIGELEDAAYVLDYLENLSESPRYVWCAGYSFGAWITLQLLMRRPEIDGFLAISPPANHYDLSFLAPCPASGLIVAGDADSIASPEDVERALSKVRVQKGHKVERAKVKGANQTLKQGTVIKSIRLTDNPDEVDCRHDAIKGLVLRTEFLRKR